jgi:hypothetical protein
VSESSDALPTRDEAVAILGEGDAAIAGLVDRVPEGEFARHGNVGGDWSVKDLVGHLTFWQENALTALKEFRAGESSSLDKALREGGLDAVNLDALAAKAAMSSKEVLSLSERVSSELVEKISGMSDEEWTRRLPGGETWGSELGEILGGPDGRYRHAWAHVEELTAFVDSLP